MHISKQAKKSLDSLPPDRKGQIQDAIKNLPGGDVKSLKGKREPYKKLRVGSYRVLFKEKDGEIYISKIEPRGGVYKGGF
ncbi:MAG: type II toxin-antitoxin system RelE/ParE family toxin [Selenomonadaceae bacterium]|nr:type II toxin-antitoxin system RelE/ParE family toxin [Selenomonadaceae bacterium]